MVEHDGSVSFCMSLYENVDPEEVKIILVQLAAGGELKIQVEDYQHFKIMILLCRTDQKTFETMFNAKLEWRDRKTSNLSRGHRQVNYWFEHKAAEVPEALKDKIKNVGLFEPIHWVF